MGRSAHCSLAPISSAGWSEIESQARQAFELHLTARRIMDFEGPLGWDVSSIALGTTDLLEGTSNASANERGLEVRRRVVRPIIELRMPFEVDRAALECLERGAGSVDLPGVIQAAERLAAAEDAAILEGYAAAGFPGILADSPNPGVALPAEPQEWPRAFAEALAQLREARVEGPYLGLLGAESHPRLIGSTGKGGYPTAKHLEEVLGAPVRWTPSIAGGAVVSLRGGDFRFCCGQDIRIGYRHHDEHQVGLYFEESFGVVLDGPEAAVPLATPDS